MSKLRNLYTKRIINPPNHVIEGLQYEVITGSIAYGISSDTSDTDIYGFSIPNKEMIFPHLNGEIMGFGKQIKRFEQYQQSHIFDKEKEYDFTIYNIIKYFQLLMDNNPNMIDSLFVPRRCVVYSTEIGEMVRSNRSIFLHKGSYHKHKGYAYSQLHKIKTKTSKGKRKELVEKYGYDTKFATHVIRLLNQAEQILTEHTLDLEKNREQLKSVRRGDWSLNDIIEYFNNKEKQLEKVYLESTLRYSPDEKKIKQLLLNCLEMYYGSLDTMIKTEPASKMLINDLKELINKYKK